MLAAFDAHDRQLGLAELSRRTRLPKTTVYRLANQLIEYGALERIDDSYRLGLRLFEIGSSVFRQHTLVEAALPYMQDLYGLTRETICLGMLDGLQVLVIDKLTGRGSLAACPQVGSRLPLHCTALGKVLLASCPGEYLTQYLQQPFVRFTAHTIATPESLMQELASVRKSGVAFAREELALAANGVAAPIIAGGEVTGSLAIMGPSHRFRPEEVSAALRSAASGISRRLTDTPAYPTRNRTTARASSSPNARRSSASANPSMV